MFTGTPYLERNGGIAPPSGRTAELAILCTYLSKRQKPFNPTSPAPTPPPSRPT